MRIARCALTIGLFALACSPPGFAQKRRCGQAESPYPQLADEINQMKAEVGPTKIEIVEMKFDGPVHLPHGVLDDLLKTEKQLEFDSNDDWISSLEERSRDAWERQGYFRVEAHAKPQFVSSDSTYQRYSVSVHVDEGLRYRLGEVQFVPADPELPANTFIFSVATLRKMIAMREGDVFDGEKVRTGIEAMTKLYGSKGYMDFTAVPQFTENDSDKRVSVVLRLSEAKQYRVEKVEVIGLSPRMERLLRSSIKMDEPINSEAIDGFFGKYKSELPVGSTPTNTMGVDRNVTNDTVSLRFEFRTCAEPESNTPLELPLSTSYRRSLIPITDPSQKPTLGEFSFRPSGSDITLRLVTIGDLFWDDIDGKPVKDHGYQASNANAASSALTHGNFMC